MLRLLILILKILLSVSCSSTCKYCKTLNETWIYNPCSDMTCSLDSASCDSKCTACNTKSENCSNPDTECIRNRSACGYPINYYTVTGNILSSTEISSGTVCYWIIDGHSYYDSFNYDTISISYIFMGNPGQIKIIGYYIPPAVNYVNIENYTPTISTINKDYYKTFNITKSNYLIIGYITDESYSSYSGISISWVITKTSSSSSDLSTEQMATIVVLAVLLVLCCGSCCTCLYKFKGYQNYARIIPAQTVNRARGYEMVPESSLSYVTENNIEQCMPKLQFVNNMIEVGVKTCCICFDELEEGAMVRKLVCKHVFHSNCIESWFVNAEGFPKCPVCKANPFQNITEMMNIHITN